MKKSLKTALAYLVIGTLASISVAWSSCIFPHKMIPPTVLLDAPNANTGWYGGSSISPLASYVWRSPTWIDQENFFGKAPILSDYKPQLYLPYWSRLNKPVNPDDPIARYEYAELEQARGWPFRCFVGYTQMHIDLNRGGWVEGEQYWAISLEAQRWKDGPHSILPLKPIPFGLCLNALIYGFTFWLIFAGPGKLHRYLRFKRGYCKECGYDLRGAHELGCPECGSGR